MLVRTTSQAVVGATVAVLVAATGAWSQEGGAIYKQSCAKCHGDTGTGDTAAGKALKVPSLVGDAKVQEMSTAEVATRIKENEKHPPAVKSMSDADIAAAAGVAKELAGK